MPQPLPTSEQITELLKELATQVECKQKDKCPKCRLMKIMFENPHIVEVCLGCHLAGNPDNILENFAAIFLLGVLFERKQLETKSLEELYAKEYSKDT